MLPVAVSSLPPPPLILASASPRRRELLAHLWADFTVLPSEVSEDSAERDPLRLAAELARLKARAVAQAHPGAAVLGADTVVALGGELLAKPGSEAENRDFLARLSGRTHTVVTGVCLVHPGGKAVQAESAQVGFRPLTETEIAFYAASGEGLDKAGGYGIQGLGMALVSRIDGDYSAVVGLPLSLTARLLRGAGYPVWGQA